MRVSDHLRKSWSGLMIGLISVLAVGCAEEVGRLDMSILAKPDGGLISTLAVLEDEAEVTVFAPSGGKIFTRRSEDQSWTGHSVSWPVTVSTPGLKLFDGLESSLSSFNFSRDQLFTAHRGMLWAVAAPTFGAAPRLLFSPDRGQSWHEAPLPRLLTEDGGVAAGLIGHPSQLPLSERLRLISTVDDELFLTDSQRLWSLDWDEDSELGPDVWTKISRAGLVFDRPSRGATLPALVRNYLPATEDRPFEVVTMLHDQLSVYRRHEGTEEWVLTAMLPTVDRQLVEVPNSRHLFILAADAIYRSDEHGEQWERQPVSAHATRGLEYSSMVALPTTDSPHGHFLLLGAGDGSLWRSLDGGMEWNEVHPRDADARGITSFGVSRHHDYIWASTAGRGVLESRDGGQTWYSQNHDLKAARIFAMSISPDGELLIGTDAGLFRQTGDRRAGGWTRIHDRGTSAIYRHPENGRLFFGTLGGSIIVQHPNGQEFVGEAAPLGRVDRILYQPVHLQSTSLPPTAIVDIQPRPGSQQMFAWSHQFGPLMSADAGASWRRM
ncbi:MAG: WD40/YVTN/BNR-like repeat-containing protein, partial [Bradymonadaceae bacterium]